MAVKRASSEGPNPFWSTRARDELALQMARPSNLPSELPPVPADGDWDLDRTPEPLMPPADGRRGRKNEKMEKGKGTSESASFRTPPSSWIRSEGEMPMEDSAEEVKQMESQHRDGAGSLEKAVEKEMVEFLLQQNRQLQDELEKMKAQRGPSTVGTSWSEVSVQPATPSTPRAVGQKSSEGEGRFRFTPGGTQVPPDSPCPRPPPLPPVPAPPSMDFQYYEMVEEENSKKARMEMGVRQWQPQEMQMDNPFWQSPVQRCGSLGMSQEDTAKCLSQAGEALNRRQVLPDTAWRRDLDREQQLQDRAWQVKDCQDGRAPHGAWPEVCQSDRAQRAISSELPLWHRAPHGADPEVCQGDRAQHAGSFNVPLWHRAPHGADRGVCQEGLLSSITKDDVMFLW